MSKQEIILFYWEYLLVPRPLLPAGESLPPAARRHQSHQVSEGEGEGGPLQRQAQTQEKEPVTQFHISQKQTAPLVSHRNVSFSTWYLHPTVLCGKFSNYQAFYWDKTPVCILCGARSGTSGRRGAG